MSSVDSIPCVLLLFEDGTKIFVPRHAVVCWMLGVDSALEGGDDYAFMMADPLAMTQIPAAIKAYPDFLRHFQRVSEVKQPTVLESKLREASLEFFGKKYGWAQFIDACFRFNLFSLKEGFLVL